MRVLVTGSCGLIGSEAVHYYASRKNEVWGIDNNMRRYFFGPGGDTGSMRNILSASFRNYTHKEIDIRDRASVLEVFRAVNPHFIIHTAAQPSHDWAAKEPFTDFDVNACGTLNLLEGLRQFCPNSVFVFLSTNKVYGDAPNHLPLEEMEMRYEYDVKMRGRGIDENLSVDGCLHSIFGASKLAADIMVQEYGRYFGLKTAAFRGGCLTGSRHAGVELHGFVSYLVECAVRGNRYSIFGYKGKQVRDQIDSSDVIQALELFRQNPRTGEYYNLGGCYENSASVLELIAKLKERFGLTVLSTYVDQARKGDHICYYSDMSKFKKHYPEFRIQKSLDTILEEMVISAQEKLTKKAA
ncbi:MAG: NAD-dependent epimerase/dehydratase family protein [Deltaproteobacteria bacterium]|nr:NAD-dependent epimerase/dehydratase family protein [Deltaproteobacteria bacterium]